MESEAKTTAARRGRALRIGCSAAIVCFALGAGSCSRAPQTGATGGGAGAQQDELRVQRLVIVDREGKERADLSATKGSGAMLAFRGKGDSVLAQIGIDDTVGPYLGIGDGGGRAMAEIGVLKEAGPVFVLRDAKGRRRVGLIVTETGTVGMLLHDEAGANRCKMEMSRDGLASLEFGELPKSPRLTMGTSVDGASALAVYDRKGPRITLELDAQGKATIALLGADEKAVWSQTAP